MEEQMVAQTAVPYFGDKFVRMDVIGEIDVTEDENVLGQMVEEMMDYLICIFFLFQENHKNLHLHSHI